LASRNRALRGYLYIATATFFWGIAATLGRGAFTGRFLPAGRSLQPIDPLILSQFRTTFSFLMLLPLLAARRGRAGLRVPGRDLRQLVVLGVLGVAASNYFYYLAIQKTNVATAIILQYSAPVLVLLYMVARGLQRATLQRVSAVALAVMGSAFAIGLGSGPGLRINAVGVAAAMAAAVSFSFYNVAGHSILARYDHWIVLLYTTLSAALFWLVVNPPWKVAAAHYTSLEWGFLLLFAMVSALVPFSFYFAGLQHLEPTRAIVASCLEPVFSIGIAAVVLGESVRPVQAIGIGFVLAAILLVQLPERGSREPVQIIEPFE
jgi:drug/metabolite transporter (DMT)-like permease